MSADNTAIAGLRQARAKAIQTVEVQFKAAQDELEQRFTVERHKLDERFAIIFGNVERRFDDVERAASEAMDVSTVDDTATQTTKRGENAQRLSDTSELDKCVLRAVKLLSGPRKSQILVEVSKHGEYSDGQVTGSIMRLKKTSKLVQTGTKNGARYFVSEAEMADEMAFEEENGIPAPTPTSDDLEDQEDD